MQLITLKRFEFSAAHQLHGTGPETRPHGHNFILWVGAAGPVSPATGMVINVVDLKAIVNAALDRYDHRHLNLQLKDVEPTTPNVALALWHDLRPALPPPVRLAAVELFEEGGNAARVADREAMRIAFGEFSAAHRTHAPRLSEAENLALYGKCDNPTGHGHNYRAELWLAPEAGVDDGLWAEFDHKNLSTDIPDLIGRNVVTETIAELVARRAPHARRVRIWETRDFFAEYQAAGARYRLGRRYQFNAAHRLNSPALSEAENRRLYGKCNRPDPHGHTYIVEVIVQGELDARTETAFDLGRLDGIARHILSPLDYTNLDSDVPAFKDRASTGENIAAFLWERFEAELDDALQSARVWETPNNQFLAHRDA